MTTQNWNVNERLKNKLIINCPENVTPLSPRLIELFCETTNIIANVKNVKTVNVFFVRSILYLIVSKYQYGLHIKDIIIYDIDKIEKFKDERKIIVIFLEELVHALLNIEDEIKTSLKVSELYPLVDADPITGKYIFK